ncbi:unnamed protein product [Linum trigynum]|uniref:Uncharacterized protein n=1 Tax=Linum trigynum TaxID=586398 RepID=A0AAV2DYP7_9ROSI
MTYDAFSQAMGLDTSYMMMTERQYTVDFHYQAAFQALCRPEHEQEEFVAGRTNEVKLRIPYRIMHTLLIRSVVPSSQLCHLLTKRGLLDLFSMRHPTEPIHLGSLIATSFAQCLGRNRVDTMHIVGIITRLARHFQVDLERCSIIGRTEPIPVATLYNQKLVLQVEWGVEYLKGLRPSGVMRPLVYPALVDPDAEGPPPEYQPTRALDRHRRPAL